MIGKGGNVSSVVISTPAAAATADYMIRMYVTNLVN